MTDVIMKTTEVVQELQGLIQVVSPVTGELITLGTAGVKAILAFKRSIGGVARNADGTPLTDEQFVQHFGIAEEAAGAVIAYADQALAEDRKLEQAAPDAPPAPGSGYSSND